MQERRSRMPYYGKIVWDACRNLGANDLFRMAGATAFFTTFALPPMMIIIVRTLGLFIERRTVGRALMESLRNTFGPQSADSILQTIRSFRGLLESNRLLGIVIFLFLVFVATSLFTIIRKSIDQLWSIRTAAHVSFRSILQSRAISVGVILAGGLLFLAIQVLGAGIELLGSSLGIFKTKAGLLFWRSLNVVVTTLMASVWLYLLFLLLPDGRPSKRIIWRGALVTAILFTTGKSLLRMLLQPVQVNSFYGVSGAIALVLLFMFYSSIFLYFGAAIIQSWSKASETPIEPKHHAEHYRMVRAD